MSELISNQDEHRRTVKRSDGELIVVRSNEDGEQSQDITLSAQDVNELLYHLTDPRAQAVFRAL